MKRTKTITQMNAQINRVFALSKELGYKFNEYYFRIIEAIDKSCFKHYGYSAHSKELSKFLKKHPELR